MMMDQQQQHQDTGDVAEEEVEGDMGNMRIAELEGVNGISVADIKKLTDAGIHTVESLAHTSKKEILQIKGISEPKCDKLLLEGAPRPPRLAVVSRMIPPVLQRARLLRWDFPPHPTFISNAKI